MSWLSMKTLAMVVPRVTALSQQRSQVSKEAVCAQQSRSTQRSIIEYAPTTKSPEISATIFMKPTLSSWM